MENKKKAVSEVLGLVLAPEQAKRYFYNVYEYFLYNDTKSFLQILDYRLSLRDVRCESMEDYYVFKFMLQLLQQTYPKQVMSLWPSDPEVSPLKNIA